LSESGIAKTKNRISFFIERCSRKELVPTQTFEQPLQHVVATAVK
jgi:hypothetical protein